LADGQGVIFVRLIPVPFRSEFVSRHSHHGIEHPFVANAARPQLRIDHPPLQTRECGAFVRKIHGSRGLRIEKQFYFLRRRMRTSKLTTPF
jgi:hypothetical protein